MIWVDEAEAFEDSEAALDNGDLQKLPQVQDDLGRAIDAMKEAPTFSGKTNTLAREMLDVLEKQYGYIDEVERTGRQRTDFFGISPQSSRYGRLKDASMIGLRPRLAVTEM